MNISLSLILIRIAGICCYPFISINPVFFNICRISSLQKRASRVLFRVRFP